MQRNILNDAAVVRQKDKRPFHFISILLSVPWQETRGKPASSRFHRENDTSKKYPRLPTFNQVPCLSSLCQCVKVPSPSCHDGPWTEMAERNHATLGVGIEHSVCVCLCLFVFVCAVDGSNEIPRSIIHSKLRSQIEKDNVFFSTSAHSFSHTHICFLRPVYQFTQFTQLVWHSSKRVG